MSMYVEFEPHSWYMGAAIKQNKSVLYERLNGNWNASKWSGYLENGWNYTIIEFEADSLKEIRQQIKRYRIQENERIAHLYAGVK